MKLFLPCLLVLVLTAFHEVPAEDGPASASQPDDETTATLAESPSTPMEVDDPLEMSTVADHRRGETPDGFHKLLQRHVEIGTRITRFDLKDDRRSLDDSYLGSIVALDDKQDLSPTKLFLDFRVSDYFGVELAYDKVAAKAVTNTGKSDGTLTMSGPITSVYVRYPNQTAFTPFAGFGLAYFSARFSEADDWRLGYDSPQEYEAAGKPSTPKGDRLRAMHVSSDVGQVIMLGLIWRITDWCAMEVFWRTMDIEADALFTSTVHGVRETTRTGKFPMENDAWGLGAKYIF